MLYKQEGTIWEDKGDQQEGREVGESARSMHDVSMCCDIIVKLTISYNGYTRRKRKNDHNTFKENLKAVGDVCKHYNVLVHPYPTGESGYQNTLMSHKPHTNAECGAENVSLGFQILRKIGLSGNA